MAAKQKTQTNTPSDVNSVFHAIWAADKARIPAFHEKRFPADIHHGILSFY